MAVATLTVDQLLAWRSGRHLLHRPAGVDCVDVVGRLVGVQAQVPSAADQVVAARQPGPRPGAVASALAERRLLRTWATRGTLRVLRVEDAPACLSLLAAGRFWEKGSWQRAFVTVDRLAAIAEAAAAALDGRTLTRAADVDGIAAARPDDAIRLLPAFDQWVLGPGTKDTTIVPADRRASISRAAGWISPVVERRGRVVGTWEAREGEPAVDLWPESPPVPADALDAERARVRSYVSGGGDA